MTFDEAVAYTDSSVVHVAARVRWMREHGDPYAVRFLQKTDFGPTVTELDPRTKQKRSGNYVVDTADKFATDWIPVTTKMYTAWCSRFT